MDVVVDVLMKVFDAVATVERIVVNIEVVTVVVVVVEPIQR